jgi:hypothetical protein
MKIESSWLKIINLLVVLGISLSSGAVALAGSGGLSHLTSKSPFFLLT